MISAVLIAGAFLSVWAWRAKEPDLGRHRASPLHPATWPWIALAVAAVLPLLVKPLLPPQDWDELAYHLPYARFWAEQGALAVNPWLRFLLMPYNMQLLYSAALVFGNDVLPHLLHAFTAALTLLLTFAAACRYFDWKTGVVAVVLLAFATRWGWSTANVDFGAMLFWSCAFMSLAVRHESGDQRFVFLAAFFAGLAVGVKYQALLYLPVFALLVWCLERRPSVLARTVLIFGFAATFWYFRNLVISGNPVHPVAGDWLGYWIWNADDLNGLNSDLTRAREWPPLYLLCSAGRLFFWRGAGGMQRRILLTAAASVAVWAIVSGYPRYLVAVYPMLALLSAGVFIRFFRYIGLATGLTASWKQSGTIKRVLVLATLTFSLLLGGFLDAKKYFHLITPDPASRVAWLKQHFEGYALLQSLPEGRPEAVYQLGFEGELYYLGPRARGDWFGPGRYSDVMTLSTDARALASHLEGLGADGFLINLGRKPFSDQSWDSAMEQYFELIGQTQAAALYKLRLLENPDG